MNLLEKIFNAGVVGAGGAGFPTHVKYNNKVDTLIINGVECEPLIGTDKYLMRNKPNEIIYAINEISKLVEAKNIFIALKETYIKEIENLTDAIKAFNTNIKLFKLNSFYPAGDEQILVYEITGKVVPPGGIPLDVGVIVTNVGTVYNVFDAINNKPVIKKYVSVVGEVKNPMIINVPLGIKISDCIEAVGGTSIKNFSVVLGGPMMGKVINKEDIFTKTITKTDGALIILPDDHIICKGKNVSLNHIINRSKSVCIQCSYCTELCPRYLIGHQVRPNKVMRALSIMDENNDVFKDALLCSECGLCEIYSCSMGLSPRRINIHIKNIQREKGKKPVKEIRDVDPLREYKKVPTSRLIAKLGLDKYSKQKLNNFKEVDVNEVIIPLKQHIGNRARATVNLGDYVSEGQVIGDINDGELGAKIHASISGIIKYIGEEIVIQKSD